MLRRPPLADEYPVVWGLLLAIGPPVTPPSPGAVQIGFFVWLICWMFWLVGLIWLGERAVVTSRELRKRADSDENTLQFQAPLWKGIEVLAQRQSTISDVSGNANIITVMNQTYNTIVQRRDEQGWWTKPVGIVAIGVIINIVSRALGVL